MTQSEFRSKIPGIINHISNGESFLFITRDKKDNDIIVGYKNEKKHCSYGTTGKTFQEIFDSLYPFLIEQGVISKKNIE